VSALRFFVLFCFCACLGVEFGSDGNSLSLFLRNLYTVPSTSHPRLTAPFHIPSKVSNFSTLSLACGI
jgi:hypothetical protein